MKSLHANYRYLLPGVCLMLLGCTAPQTRTPSIDSVSSQEEARKQREMVLEDYMNADRKLQSVAAKIIVSGAELCGTQIGPYFGISAWTQDQFQKEWKQTVQSRFNLSEQVHLSNVVAGSTADLAGLKQADVIVSINQWLPPVGKDGPGKLMEKLSEFGKTAVPVEFMIRRGTEELKFIVPPVQACNFQVRLLPDDVKNAYADGKHIVIYKGMMDFFRSDEEIALVVSHELAHNAMKHIDAKQSNSIVGGLAGLLLDIAAAAGGVNTGGDFTRMGAGAGAGAYSVEFEQEADYVGLYFMALAGYKIDDAPAFWRRMATTNSSAISIKSSHPTTPDRFVALETTVKEINQKIAAQQSLKPEMKKVAESGSAQ